MHIKIKGKTKFYNVYLHVLKNNKGTNQWRSTFQNVYTLSGQNESNFLHFQSDYCFVAFKEIMRLATGSDSFFFFFPFALNLISLSFGVKENNINK